MGEPQANKTPWFLFDLFFNRTQFPTHVWLRVYSTYFTGKLDQVRVTQFFIFCIIFYIIKNKSTTKPNQPCNRNESNLKKEMGMKQIFKKKGRFGILGPPTTKLKKKSRFQLKAWLINRTIILIKTIFSSKYTRERRNMGEGFGKGLVGPVRVVFGLSPGLFWWSRLLIF